MALPDNQHALSGSADKTVKLFNVNDGAVLRTFKHHTARSVTCLALLPDGLRFVSGRGPSAPGGTPASTAPEHLRLRLVRRAVHRHARERRVLGGAEPGAAAARLREAVGGERGRSSEDVARVERPRVDPRRAVDERSGSARARRRVVGRTREAVRPRGVGAGGGGRAARPPRKSVAEKVRRARRGAHDALEGAERRASRRRARRRRRCARSSSPSSTARELRVDAVQPEVEDGPPSPAARRRRRGALGEQPAGGVVAQVVGQHEAGVEASRRPRRDARVRRQQCADGVDVGLRSQPHARS